MTYKLLVNDRNYISWSIVDSIYFKEVQLNVHPVQEKLFTNDFFQLNSERKPVIVHSSVRSSTIPGVLILHGNKTYGRKNGKLLYKCIPDDMRLPPFLIPYEMKQIGFLKVFVNKYVTFSYTDWNEKHPHGVLTQTIGPVDVLDNFYEYQLYCKSLNASIQKFQKDANRSLQANSHETFIQSILAKYPCIENRTQHWNIFSIDPAKSLDFDDAFSIKLLDDGVQQLSIYISNVTIWMDVLNLWESFSRRISTIYLPDRKRPMLPTILSDCLCSLQAGNTRVALVMDIFFKDDVIKIQYSNCAIKVAKNYVYEEPTLLQNPDYLSLLNSVKLLSKKYKYIHNIKDSHDLVCYLMIFMNYHCAKSMIHNKNGVFRSTIIHREFAPPTHLPEDVIKFIKIWNSGASGQYINGQELQDSKNDATIRHDLLELDAYIHITSPIRRLVDLLNIIQLQKNNQLIILSEKADAFYNKWLGDLEYINATMRSIKKVQIDCNLLDLCCNNPDIMAKEYTGYVFDKINRNDQLYQFLVFLPELKLTSRIVCRENFENYENKKFKLYLFNDEESFKKKIRLHLI